MPYLVLRISNEANTQATNVPRLSSPDSSLVRAHYPTWNELRFGALEQLAPQRFADGLGLPDLFIGRRTWGGVEVAGGVTFLGAGHEAIEAGDWDAFLWQQVMYQVVCDSDGYGRGGLSP